MADWGKVLEVARDDVPRVIERTTLLGPTVLYGEPGLGKTWDCSQLAGTLGLRLVVAHCDSGTLASQWLDRHTPGGDGVWRLRFGPIIDAWGHGPSKQPGLLVLDDCHLAGPDLTPAFYVALDDPDNVKITLEDDCPCGCGSQTIGPKPGYRAVLTMNGTPDLLDEPIKSRVLYKVPITAPSRGQLKALKAPLGGMCKYDYARGAGRIAEYREYKAISLLWDMGEPLKLALALGLGGGRDSADRVKIIAQGMAQAKVPEAIALLADLGEAAPSGAPDATVGGA